VHAETSAPDTGQLVRWPCSSRADFVHTWWYQRLPGARNVTAPVRELLSDLRLSPNPQQRCGGVRDVLALKLQLYQ
jgi:hypothetical protein